MSNYENLSIEEKKEKVTELLDEAYKIASTEKEVHVFALTGDKSSVRSKSSYSLLWLTDCFLNDEDLKTTVQKAIGLADM